MKKAETGNADLFCNATIRGQQSRRWQLILYIALILSPISNSNAANILTQQLTGICLSIKELPESIEVAKSMGVNSIRIDAPWSEIELSKGNYKIPNWMEKSVDLSLKENIKPMLILDYGNNLYGGDKPKSKEAIEGFTKYAQFVVTHFKNKVKLYEVWNEWHTHTGNTTPTGAAEYISLLKNVYPAVKSVSPEIVVIAGSFSTEAMDNGWVQDFIDLAGYKFSDAISIHPYVYMFSGVKQTPGYAIEVVDKLESWMRKVNGGRDYPVYITEFGYPTNTGKFGINEEVRSNYIKNFFWLVDVRDYIHGVWWYGLNDQGDDSYNKEHRFGMFGSDSKIKSTGLSFKELNKSRK